MGELSPKEVGEIVDPWSKDIAELYRLTTLYGPTMERIFEHYPDQRQDYITHRLGVTPYVSRQVEDKSKQMRPLYGKMKEEILKLSFDDHALLMAVGADSDGQKYPQARAHLARIIRFHNRDANLLEMLRMVCNKAKST